MPKRRQHITFTDQVFYKLERDRLWRKQNKKCKYCGCDLKQSEATMDHVVPISKVGYHSFDNCVVACYDCNQDKGNDEDWVPPNQREREPWMQTIDEWKLKIDERLRKFEYGFEIDTKGSYNKWVRYWEKRGRWE